MSDTFLYRVLENTLTGKLHAKQHESERNGLTLQQYQGFLNGPTSDAKGVYKFKELAILKAKDKRDAIEQYRKTNESKADYAPQFLSNKEKSVCCKIAWDAGYKKGWKDGRGEGFGDGCEEGYTACVQQLRKILEIFLIKGERVLKKKYRG